MGEKMIIGRDILILTADKFLGFTPWKLALIFFLAGPGVISVFYAGLIVSGSPLLELRGLYSYYSATIGDGILLPIAAAVTVSALRNMEMLIDLSLKSKEAGLRQRASKLVVSLGGRKVGWIPGLLALATTAIVHAFWLLDPQTEPNWTMVSARLNFFGYWHAAFFCFVLWWFLAFLGRLVLVAKGLLGQSESQSLACVSLRIWGEMNVFLGSHCGFRFTSLRRQLWSLVIGPNATNQL